MGKIYVSFPVPNPDHYHKNKTSWAQITYFVYHAISRDFPGKVTYIPYGKHIPMKKEDVLISCAPNDQLTKIPERSIIIDNDNFEVGKWKRGKFEKYGINAQTDHTFPFNKFLTGLYGAVFKTNDIAIKKWNSNDEDVLEKKQFLVKNIQSVVTVPHPIDKDYFTRLYNPNLKLNNLKMLIYHAPWRKNATQLINMLRRNKIPTDKYSIISGMQKSTNNVKKILSEFAYLAHTSYSEGFPYFANEFLCQGLVLYGHEEWWEPYGYNMLKWTYDPQRQEKNLANINKILNNDFKDQYYLMRNNIVQSHINREDNNWSYLNGKLINMIKELLG